MKLPDVNKSTVSVIGLGYVGFPLAFELSKSQKIPNKSIINRKVIGFDINKERIKQLKEGYDNTNEIDLIKEETPLLLELTTDEEQIINSDVFIVTVPTPIDKNKKPDLNPLKNACETIGRVLKKRKSSTIPIIIYESTVFPGATEEICIPIIEKTSSLTLNKEFLCGYSPERINPGDSTHKLRDIKKVVSGSNHESANWIYEFYKIIIDAGVFKAKSIKVAEAAKIIENTQRDLNIALMNELAIIFDLMKIDNIDVLEAASTKWNFLNFKPGLVGGHCIGVDPYYLTYKAEKIGYYPHLVLAGRMINDNMPDWIIEKLIYNMAEKNINIIGSKILILGITFKENCPDLRNSLVINLIEKIKKLDMKITIVDPYVDTKLAFEKHKLLVLRDIPKQDRFDVLLTAVGHNNFKNINKKNWKNLIKENGFFFDLKGLIPRELNPIRIM
tara:strand:- start:567 stop:1901 length:1335 start_codon:yes stop_codon:yes gene_type:complete